ncbi:MAG: right-handed parallel beta-helix repeat-containing protein [Spirochaetes bacterium]|nr:right-handed parallel beta-helix repeat-containing protein [Spirochaetota bacterium]
MSRLKSILFFPFIILLAVVETVPSYATLFYVKTNGSNIADGTNWAQAWQTIGHAATNAFAGDTVIVSNGIYNEQIKIPNSGNPGNYITFTAYEERQATVDGTGSTECFHLDGKSYIRIKGFIIKNAINEGIYIDNNSAYNIIVKNTLFSNFYCVLIQGLDSDNNFIASNLFGPSTNSYGIRMAFSDNNIIASNSFYDLLVSIFFDSSTNNYIINNFISNMKSQSIISGGQSAHIMNNTIMKGLDGIDIGSDNGLVENNQLLYNSRTGIRVSGTRGLRIRGNSLIGDSYWGGIYIEDGMYSASIVSNIIRCTGNQQDYGIRLFQATNNIIKYNQIIQNQYDGIYAQHGNSNIIYRNLIISNNRSGIYCESSVTNLAVINNTISLSPNGLIWKNDTSGFLFNNIILSNTFFGISNASMGSVYADYNDFYGNGTDLTNGPVLWGSHNITENPFLDTTGDYRIIFGQSPVIDSGTNIPGITDAFFSFDPDMGWLESGFIKPQEYISPSVAPDKLPGKYFGDIILRFSVFQDQSMTVVDTTAIIFVTVFRNNVADRTLSGTATLDIPLSAGYEYTLSYYARDRYYNMSKTNQALYTVLKGAEDIAVYPTMVKPDEVTRMIIVYRNGKQDTDIRICNLRGDIVKEINGADLSTGAYEYDVQNLRFLPPGQYSVRINNKRAMFYLIK